MSLLRRYKARASPGHPRFAQHLDLPSALFTLHPGWDFSICNVLLLEGRGKGMNWKD